MSFAAMDTIPGRVRRRRDVPTPAGYAVFDCETTGIDPERDEIVSFAVVRLNADGDEVARLTTLVRPSQPIPPEVTAVHGISDADVASAPTFAELALELLVLLDGAVFVAHNAGFDLSMLKHDLAVVGVKYRPPAVACTLEAFRLLEPLAPAHNLEALCGRYEIELDAHNALGDALATAALLRLVLAAGLAPETVELDEAARVADAFARRRSSGDRTPDPPRVRARRTPPGSRTTPSSSSSRVSRAPPTSTRSRASRCRTSSTRCELDRAARLPGSCDTSGRRPGYRGRVDPLDGLNPEQRRAAEAVRGPVCILAGAGTGKTTTITRRIAQQVATGAFRARRDHGGDVHRQGRRRACARVSRRSASRGCARGRSTPRRSASCDHFAPDAVGGILPSKALPLRNLGNKLPGAYKFRPAGDLAAEIEWAKNRRIGPDAYLKAAADREPPIPHDLMARIYRDYERGKAEQGLMDFEDLLESAIRLFEENEQRRRDVPRAVPRLHRRRVPGRQPPPADAPRPLARRPRRPLRRRRRLPVDLRVHRRRA